MEELVMPRLLTLVEGGLDKVEKKFLDDVRDVMKEDEGMITNNNFFDAHEIEKSPPGGYRMTNLRRENGLHTLLEKIVTEVIKNQQKTANFLLISSCWFGYFITKNY